MMKKNFSSLIIVYVVITVIGFVLGVAFGMASEFWKGFLTGNFILTVVYVISAVFGDQRMIDDMLGE